MPEGKSWPATNEDLVVLATAALSDGCRLLVLRHLPDRGTIEIGWWNREESGALAPEPSVLELAAEAVIDESSQFVLLHAAQPVTTVPLRMLEAPDIRGYRKGSDGNLPLTDGEERPSPASRAVAHEVPYLSVADLTAVGQIGLGFATAWTLPERYWNGLTRAIARARLRAQPGWAAAQRRYLRRWVGEGDIGMSFDALLEAYLANRRVSKLQAFRCRHPAGWNPRTALEGRAFLDEALARGRGAILWVAPFVFGPLLTKMALYRAGHTCSHLSRYSHGFSQSRLGAQLLNPVRADVEERFLAERVVIGRDGSVHAAMRRLTARLHANGVVSVNGGRTGRGPWRCCS